MFFPILQSLLFQPIHEFFDDKSLNLDDLIFVELPLLLVLRVFLALAHPLLGQYFVGVDLHLFKNDPKLAVDLPGLLPPLFGQPVAVVLLVFLHMSWPTISRYILL